MTITIAGHGFVNGEHIKITDNSLTFTCAKDVNATQHTYPRVTDPVSNKWLVISGVTTDTFNVQVLDSVPSTNVSTHAFVSATTNAIKRSVISTGGDYAHTFVSAVSNCVSYKPQEAHTFVSAGYGCVRLIRNTHTSVSYTHLTLPTKA